MRRSGTRQLPRVSPSLNRHGKLSHTIRPYGRARPARAPVGTPSATEIRAVDQHVLDTLRKALGYVVGGGVVDYVRVEDHHIGCLPVPEEAGDRQIRPLMPETPSCG